MAGQCRRRDGAPPTAAVGPARAPPSASKANPAPHATPVAFAVGPERQRPALAPAAKNKQQSLDSEAGARSVLTAPHAALSEQHAAAPAAGDVAVTPRARRNLPGLCGMIAGNVPASAPAANDDHQVPERASNNDEHVLDPDAGADPVVTAPVVVLMEPHVAPPVADDIAADTLASNGPPWW